MEVADFDGNGTIDLQELSHFVERIQGAESVEKDVILKVYKDVGGNEKEGLSVELFGQAILRLMKQ
jgi:homoaconitase/3-isopropylmalate dehydratase large subunit